MDNLFGNFRQMQAIADKPVALEPDVMTLQFSKAPVQQVQTLVSSGATELGDTLADRTRVIIRNLDPIRRARIGDASITEKVGIILEPLGEVVIEIAGEALVNIYGRAMYAELKVEVIES